VIVFWPGLVSQHMVPAFAAAVLGGGAGWLLGLMWVKHPLLGELRQALAFLHGRLQGMLS